LLVENQLIELEWNNHDAIDRRQKLVVVAKLWGGVCPLLII